ncbi:MAG: hypothetical protein LBU73_07380 [Helicobacteraceae bacterium]|jgi:hypothetical protein|nr:hypothetical protein [Helicobacteraceae bacterium]
MNTEATEGQSRSNEEKRKNMENAFEIKILKLHWVDKNDPTVQYDDREDLCLHGELFIRIGNEVLLDFESGAWTLSAASLFLMRTLKMDYKPDDFENLLIPCCGHFIIAEENQPVQVCGCPNGAEWTIKHIDGGFVKHISSKGEEATITEEEYRKIVFDFADKVEQFYKDNPRVLPTDEFELQGYNAFWKEWRKMRYE